MPIKKQHGNMYEWVTKMHSFLGGECPHGCKYCYVGTGVSGRPPRYTGVTNLVEAEFKHGYGFPTPQVIFIEHMQDLFAEGVPDAFILRVLAHCKRWPKNTYVFQTKNPLRYQDFLSEFPVNCILGTTIESDIWYPEAMGKAPLPYARYIGMTKVPKQFKRFLTIEPVMRFSLEQFSKWIAEIKPDFINLGANSKELVGLTLVEPTVEEVMALVAELHTKGVELREKGNLERLKTK